MAQDRGLAGRVCRLTAGLVVLIAAVAWFFAGPGEAAGALVGGGLTIASFLWLSWTAGVVLQRPPARAGSALRQALWIGASGARFGVIALALGIVIAQGWVGRIGLLLALAALPVTVVAEGLRTARMS